VSKSAVLAIYLVTFLKVINQVTIARSADPFRSVSFVWEMSAPTLAHQHTVGMEVNNDGS
jgi:hypothetical protein